ncbi:hypothetical protein BJV82DRAFT_592075 [Fennellomyces sp. T-0311]|nr:hypothetical protein BJV82DRAFT_592075 [Fennellomyces sp. T-0311]
MKEAPTARDQACQKHKIQTSMRHKVSKQHVRTCEIAVNPPASVTSNTEDVHAIAKRLKQRLSDAMSKIADVSMPAPVATPPRLDNLTLLRQYLRFIQESGTTVDIKPADGAHKIEIAVPDKQQECVDEEKSRIARLGARLIESHVHSQSKMSTVIDTPEQATPYMASRRSTDRRRRPGRPPAKDKKPERIRRRSRNVMSYTSVVKCICDTPDEEFGSMVQCDDCERWLHLDCLKMSEDAVGETFRCPLCFIAIGEETTKRVSSVTWRFAARRASERMATVSNSDSETSDYEDGPPPLDERSRTPEQSDEDLSTLCSEDTESPSEASTPEQGFYATDPFEAMETEPQDQLMLDPDSIEFLSRLVYLQSIDSVQKEIFAPNASDVFLCENSNNRDPVAASSTGLQRYPSETLPSSMCPQLLKEFSFDSGPFWKTMR